MPMPEDPKRGLAMTELKTFAAKGGRRIVTMLQALEWSLNASRAVRR